MADKIILLPKNIRINEVKSIWNFSVSQNFISHGVFSFLRISKYDIMSQRNKAVPLNRTSMEIKELMKINILLKESNYYNSCVWNTWKVADVRYYKYNEN
jgi:hypothetical protein